MPDHQHDDRATKWPGKKMKMGGDEGRRWAHMASSLASGISAMAVQQLESGVCMMIIIFSGGHGHRIERDNYLSYSNAIAAGARTAGYNCRPIVVHFLCTSVAPML